MFGAIVTCWWVVFVVVLKALRSAKSIGPPCVLQPLAGTESGDADYCNRVGSDTALSGVERERT